MEFEAEIKDFIQDRGINEGDDGRLLIQTDFIPKHKVIPFLEKLGYKFIEQGGLYAVDIKNPMGVYRVYNSNKEVNGWIKFKNQDILN